MSEVKGQSHTLYPVSNQCISFSFHINRSNHSWDMAKTVFDLEETHPKLLKQICQNYSFQEKKTFPKSNQVITTSTIKLSCLQWSDEWFLLYHADKQILLIDTNAMTLGRGHRRVTHLPAPYLTCPKYLRWSQNGFGVRGKVVAAADAAETNWKHKATQAGVCLNDCTVLSRVTDCNLCLLHTVDLQMTGIYL